MGTFLAISSVIVALIAAGAIIYLARELTSKANLPDGPDKADGEESG